MNIIDKSKWIRKSAYEAFIGYDNPTFSICSRLDVTNLYNFCKANGKSFFASLVFVITRELNAMENFRLRIKGRNVVLYDKVDPSYVVLADDGAITTSIAEMTNDFEEFHKTVTADIQKVKKEGSQKKFGSKILDVVYFSSLKWVDFTSVNNPYNYRNAENTSIPRVTIGKFVDENGRKKMAMDISAHHALVDGEPLAKAYNNIQTALNNITNDKI